MGLPSSPVGAPASMDHFPKFLGLAASPATACWLGGEQMLVARSTRHSALAIPCELSGASPQQQEPIPGLALYNALPA